MPGSGWTADQWALEVERQRARAERAEAAAWAVVHSLYDAGEGDTDIMECENLTAHLNRLQTQAIQDWFATVRHRG